MENRDRILDYGPEKFNSIIKANGNFNRKIQIIIPQSTSHLVSMEYQKGTTP